MHVLHWHIQQYITLQQIFTRFIFLFDTESCNKLSVEYPPKILAFSDRLKVEPHLLNLQQLSHTLLLSANFVHSLISHEYLTVSCNACN